jgi:D-alanyl-lipoteichoic acid acyltransferase DltB (MBOAT superfamily)
MLTETKTFLFFVVFTVMLFWSLPSTWTRARAGILILSSSLLIYIVSPLSLGLCLAFTLTASLHNWLYRRQPNGWLTFAAVTLMTATMFAGKLIWDKSISLTATIGLSYIALKSISVVVDFAGEQEQGVASPSFPETLLLNLFFPIYSAGPIEKAATFRFPELATRFNVADFNHGAARIGLGIFKVSFLANALINFLLTGKFANFLNPQAQFSLVESHLYIWLMLLRLYFDFSGYTDIAIGVSRLFGIHVMENFRWPFSSRNIQDLWQRWHITLGNFVFGYIFFPLMRLTGGRATPCIILAFAGVGLWHGVSVKWLTWGLAQGVGLAAVPLYKGFVRKHPVLSKFRTTKVHAALAWFLTMTYFAWSISFALTSNTGDAAIITQRILGLL